MFFLVSRHFTASSLTDFEWFHSLTASFNILYKLFNSIFQQTKFQQVFSSFIFGKVHFISVCSERSRASTTQLSRKSFMCTSPANTLPKLVNVHGFSLKNLVWFIEFNWRSVHMPFNRHCASYDFRHNDFNALLQTEH